MKQLYVLAVTVFLSIFLVVSINAAPAGTSDTVEIPQGLTNAKKVMQSKIERDKKMHQKLNKAQAIKEEAQSKKQTAVECEEPVPNR